MRVALGGPSGGAPASGGPEREPVGGERPEFGAPAAAELDGAVLPPVDAAGRVFDGGPEEPGRWSAPDDMAGRLPSPAGRGRVGAARPGRRGWGLAWDPAADGNAGSAAGGARNGAGEAGNGDGEGAGIGRRSGGKTPEYPRLAREEGWEGTVSLELLVTDRGAVAEARVAKSSGHVALDEAALEAARTWTFEPARRGGVATAARVRMPVTFRLTD